GVAEKKNFKIFSEIFCGSRKDFYLCTPLTEVRTEGRRWRREVEIRRIGEQTENEKKVFKKFKKKVCRIKKSSLPLQSQTIKGFIKRSLMRKQKD
ncbi:hypothetical protein, partial [Pedobacter montanisoli]